MKKGVVYFLGLASIFATEKLHAQLSIPATGVDVVIDFESTVPGVNNGNMTGIGYAPNPSLGQLDSDAWSVIGLSTGTLNFGGTFTSGDFAKGVSGGGVSGGGNYAFIVAPGDTACGFQGTGSDFTPGSITLKGINNTGGNVDSLRISYDLYYYNDATRGSTFNPSFSLDNTAFTALNSLNDTSIEASSSSPNWTVKNKAITIAAALADTDDFYIKWDSSDPLGSGSRDEIAIDNITIRAIVASVSTGPVTTISLDSTIQCNGFSDAGLTATTSGGTAPYSYLWSNGASTASITGLSAGVYSVTVTDNAGATSTSTTTVTEPASVVSMAIVDSNVTQNAGMNGGATASATGGTAPYSYLWSNSASLASISGVMAGTYSVTITDANGCTDSSSVTITEPAVNALLVGININANVSCNGGTDGTAKATVTGGTTPYTYLWSPMATGQGTDSISGLPAGKYYLTVTDNTGTMAQDSITISEPIVLSTSLLVSNVTTTGGADGSVDLTVNGGTAPYNYLWSNGATTEDISGLTAGSYTITLTDANGCTTSNLATLIAPGALANLIVTEINYNGPEGGSDTSEFVEFVNAGMNTVQLNGYSFSQGFIHTFGMNDSITAGQYFVIALDSSGFRNRYGFEADAIWTSGGLSNSGEDITLVDNFGRTVDSVDYDDNAPWPSQPDGSGPSLVLCDSTTDNNVGSNWAAANSIVMGQIINGAQVYANPGSGAKCISPLMLSVLVDSTVSCNGFTNGGATASASDGLAPYSYLWSNGATTASITGVSAGAYTVTVTDGLGNTELDSAVIAEPALLSSSTTVSNVTTVGGSDGSINLSVIGGSTPYNYLWSNGSITEDQSSLSVGVYYVTISDANGCTQLDSGIVNGPTAVNPTITSTNVSCNGGIDGTAKVTAAGGSTPYTYLWSPMVTGQGTDSISGLSAGKYYLTVTDNAGTTAQDSVTISEPTALSTSLMVGNVSTTGGADGSIDLTVNGGTAPYNYLWSNGATTEDISSLVAGNYTITLTDGNACTLIDSATVIEPGVMANLIITEINYNGPESGSDTSEFVEFVNAGMNTIQLNGYNFPQGFTHTFGMNDSITAGQYFVIAVDSSSFRNRYGFDADAIWTSGGLSNSGEDIVLADNFGRTIDSVDYDDNAPWPSGGSAGQPDGGGASIELIDSSLNNNIGSNWVASSNLITGVAVNGLQVFATPGMRPLTVGIEQQVTEKKQFSMYPNPTQGFVTIEAEGVEPRAMFQLISLNGKVLVEQEFNQNKVKLDLQEYADGLYFVRLGKHTKKLIIKK